MMKVCTAAFCLLGTVFVSPASAQTNAPAPALRPNVVMILVDDQRWDDFGYMGHPFIRTPHIDRVAREGVRFNNAFVTTPLSSPSRGSFMTGQYAHTHGVLDNVPRNELSHQLVTFPRMLKDAGYTTAFVGKWHMGNDDTARPGFDHWVSSSVQGDSFNLDLNVDGKRKRVNDYVTDVFTDYAVDFLKRDYDRPLCLVLSHRAIQPDLAQNPDGSLTDATDGKFAIAQRHEKLYTNKPILRRPNFGNPLGKPALLRPLPGLPPLSEKTATDDETVRNRLRMLASVDESVQRVLEILEDTGKLDNTLFIFSSDQGYFYGEHGLGAERRLAYEESIRIPLLMRLPKVFKPGTAMDGIVLNIDIAPTVSELAGVTPVVPLQGRSLVPAAVGSKALWRNSALIEYFSKNDKLFLRTQNLSYQAVRTDGWKYIHYTEIDNSDELYDLRADPYEQKNLFWEPGAQGPLMKMQLELVRQVKETN